MPDNQVPTPDPSITTRRIELGGGGKRFFPEGVALHLSLVESR